MGEPIDFYVNMLAGNMAGLSAVGALKSLDDAAAKATAGIGDLESKVEEAKARLDTLSAGEGVKNLTAELGQWKAKLDEIKSGKVPFDAAEYKRASDEVGKLGSKLETAKSKQAESVDAQQKKVAALTGKLNEQKNAHAANANLVAAKRSLMVKGLDEQVTKLGQLSAAAKEAGVPGAGLLEKLQGIAKAGPVAGVAALAVAFVALAAAAVAAAVALGRYVLIAADAARSSALLSAAATGSGSAGWELEQVVSQLSNTIPQAREKTAEWARELALAGIAGRDMQRTLTAMGVVASAVGDQAGQKIKGIAEASRMAQRFLLGARDRFGEFASLQGTGIKAADIYAAVAKSMRVSIPEAARLVQAGIVPLKKGLEALELAAETKFGGIVARQMASLATQGQKLRENLAGLFSKVNIEVFLQGLKSVTDLFAENTVLGYTLRTVFGQFFSDLSDKSKGIFPLIRAGIYGVAFAIITLLTWGKKLVNVISEAFGERLKGIDAMKTAFALGAAAVGGFVAALLFIPIVLAAITASLLIMTLPLWLPFVLGALAIYGMVKAFDAVKEKITSTFDALKDIDLGKAAENIMNSLIDGIKAKIADVTSAISSVASAITGDFDQKMEIQSPSKAMTRRANYVVDPLVTVPEKRESEVRAAFGGLGGLDEPRALPPGQPTGQSAPTFAFNNCTFGGDPEEHRRVIREEFTAFFLANARGAAGAPA